ncbi:MAG: hypothetical protein WBB23_17485 [Desulforhopalus sp.]
MRHRNLSKFQVPGRGTVLEPMVSATGDANLGLKSVLRDALMNLTSPEVAALGARFQDEP